MRIAMLLALVALPVRAQVGPLDLQGALQAARALQAAQDGRGSGARGTGLCPEPGGTPAYAPPDRPAFVRLLDELRRDFARRAGDAIPALERSLAATRNDRAGANAALPLSLAGNASAAVYAATWSCARRPDDATFAADLGALLEGLEDPRALPVLSWAVSRSPAGVLPNTNLGWYLFNHGELARAKASFGIAARKAPGLGPVLLGQGLVAFCQGDRQAALVLLTRALSVTSSPTAEQALDQVREEEAQDPSPSTSPSAVTAPRRDDWTRGARPPRVAIAQPIVSASNEEHHATGRERNKAIVAGYQELAERLVARQQGLDPNAGRDRPAVRTPTSLTLFRGDDALAALARAQYTAYDARRRAARAPFERDLERQLERVSASLQGIQRDAEAGPPEQYLAALCRAMRPALESEYGKFKVSWGGAWEGEQQAIREYGTTAAATISQVRHGDLRRYLDLERQLHLVAMAMDGPADVAGWASLGGAIMACDPSPAGPPAASADPSEDAAPAPCPPFLRNGVGMDVIVASVSLDCEKISFQAGEGIIGRFEQNYVKHEQTYFLGVGADAQAFDGAVGMGVEGSAGVFVTCSGNTVRDVGFQASGSASVGVLKGEVSGTVAAFSGPSATATGSLNLGPASLGGPSY